MEGENGMEIDDESDPYMDDPYYHDAYYYAPHSSAYSAQMQPPSISYEPPVYSRVEPVSSSVPIVVPSSHRFNSRSRRHHANDIPMQPVTDSEKAVIAQILNGRVAACRQRQRTNTGRPNLKTQVQIGAMNMKNFNLKEKDKIVIPLYRPNMNTTIDVTVTGDDLPQLKHTTLVLQILVDKPKSDVKIGVWRDVKCETQSKLFEDIIPVEGCQVRSMGGILTMNAMSPKQKMEVKFQLVNISRKSRAGRMSRFGPIYRIVAHHELLNGHQYVVEEKHCVFGIINTGKYQTYQQKYASLIENLTTRSDLVKRILDDEDKDGSAKDELALLLNMMDTATVDDETQSSDAEDSPTPLVMPHVPSSHTVPPPPLPSHTPLPLPPKISPPLSQISMLSQPDAMPQQFNQQQTPQHLGQ